ncbi:glucan biosynthesis protein [Thalassospira sp. GB04J01]|uniref:glucan biosynthesis protein n=1 Tax=Thalassospira sp. GB04J01 TaxID=1485225 RepID=UPI000C9C273F|nr:glucan biosynthesis protein [Thalassospira sp. GB04J01]
MMQNSQRRSALSLKHVLLVAFAAGSIVLGTSHTALAQDSKPASASQGDAAVPAKPKPGAAAVATPVADKTTPVADETTPVADEAAPSGADVVPVQDPQNEPAPQDDTTARPADATPPAAVDQDKPVTSVPVAFDPKMVIDRARALAAKPFEDPHRDLPDALANLSAEEYDQIRFKSQRAFFSQANSGFSLELFHPGNMYDVPIAINLVRDGNLQVVPYSAGLFDFGEAGLSGNDFSTQGYAGFRLRYPLSDVTSNDELARFLGASYFRLQGEGQSIGQMARGLALDLAGPTGEEVPVFREFWIVAPKKGERKITVYALLDSARVTGAYRFDIIPGADSKADIRANLFFREGIEKVGLAPLNGMFLFGEQRRRTFEDYRGEVHSSDGLLINNGHGEWLWRPLDNPVNLQISSFLDENPRGFGLLQRDRDFDHYQDLDRRFDQQPGYWVTPKGNWGKGHVELVEIPIPSESNDNIVAYWVPETKPVAGGEMQIEYSITATRDGDDLHHMAQATDTRIMRIAPQGDDEPAKTRFVLNFAGGDLDYFTKNIAKMKANVSAAHGTVENIRLMADPENGGVRVIFDLLRDGDVASSDLRAFLLYDEQVLSETWTMPWVF